MPINNKQEFLDSLRNSIVSYPIVETRDKAGVLSHLDQRREEALKTFLLLYRKKYYFDSFLCCGYFLELSAKIYYIENGDLLVINRDIASAAVANLTILLLMDFPIDQTWEQENQKLVDDLTSYGGLILKNAKNNQEIVSFLNDVSKTNNEKIKKLKEGYKLIPIEEIKENYVHEVEERLNKNCISAKIFPNAIKLFRTAYNHYCACKHSNIISFDYDEEYLKEISLYFMLIMRAFEKKSYFDRD